MDSTTERCPWCGTLISRAKFAEISERIRQEEKKKLADLEAAMRKRLEDKFRGDLEQEKAKVVRIEAAERKQLEEKVKVLGAREASMRKQLADDAAKALKKQLDEQRAILERDRDQATLRLRAEFTREREATQKKVADLERQLQKKTAHELGDGAEIDLFEALREAFPGDRITRVKKGETGADIHHEVLYKGESCGRIVIDSKNRKAWQNVFASKLHEDQVAAKAEHAILATNVFPAGRKEPCVHEGVLVVSPAGVVFISKLLRSHMVRMHVQGLSMKERSGKMGRLYKYMTSEACSQRFKEVAKIADDILELDVQEVKEHGKRWETRGRLVTRLKGVWRELDTEINAILEAMGEEVAETA